MKQILIIILILSAGLYTKAQLSTTPSGNLKIMSVEEANRLNGTAQPVINGKAYSQYKAEVQAKEQAAKIAVVQTPQVPEQFRLDPNKKWSGPVPANAPKAETQKPVAVVTTAVAKPAEVNNVMAPAPLLTLPLSAPSVETKTAPAESPAKIGKPEEVKAQPIQTEKPKGQQ